MKHKSMLRKLIFSLALALGLGLGAAAVCSFADQWTDPNSNIIYTYTLNGNNATITAVSPKPSGYYAIPSSLGEYPVTTIGSSSDNSGGVFYGSTITGLEIPNSVTTIGEYAFSSCSGLTSVIIPSTVTSIGEFAFVVCSKLTSVTFKEGSQLTSIGKSAFSRCKDLKNIEIPNSVTSIGLYAFNKCENLTNIKIPEGVTSIEQNTFSECSKLTSVTFVGNSQLTSIAYQAFYGCSNLTSITIPNRVESIDEQGFCWCESLTSVTIPNSVTLIGSKVFYNCKILKNAFIPNNNNITIGENAIPSTTNVWRYGVVESASDSADGKTHVNITAATIGEGVIPPVLLSPNAMGRGYVIDSPLIVSRSVAILLPLGDISGDEEVDVIDLQMFYNHFANIKRLNAKQTQRADINEDGNINVLDLQALFNIIANS